MNVLHLPTSTGGNAYGLSRGERQLGIHSDVLVVNNDYIQYPADVMLFKKPPRNKFEKLFVRPCISMKYIRKIIREYDTFHFNYGSSVLDFPLFGLTLLDLPLYKDQGKVFVTYNGCDARQKYSTMERVPFSACHRDDCYGGICKKSLGYFDKLKSHKIKKFDKYADAIFSVNPDLLHFLPERAQFLPYTIANWDSIERMPNNQDLKKIRVLHAPTNRGAKGSDIIINALHQARRKYGNIFELELVEGVTHEEALKKISKADLVIDQILVGWYGGLAVEAMKMGKPVMAYIREEDLHYIPPRMADDCKKAIINADPSTIFEKICEIIDSPQILKDFSESGLDYVNTWHDPIKVAEITRNAYNL